MIIKISSPEGDFSHFIEVSGAVRVERVPNVRPETWKDLDLTPEMTAEWMYFIAVDDRGRLTVDNPGVVIRPEGLPLRTYLTNRDAYLMSDKGKTIEVLHRQE